ncbi:unnamed protein product [Prorocentrum cordatum]|uniref:Uncharacterized protein n=1 Tax=Prorocentrum cordatum TaxID=2364126 RepID=A0ABN9TIM9_9DINO|nr:unnamed protein product [Polarella glacialis]
MAAVPGCLCLLCCLCSYPCAAASSVAAAVPADGSNVTGRRSVAARAAAADPRCLPQDTVTNSDGRSHAAKAAAIEASFAICCQAQTSAAAQSWDACGEGGAGGPGRCAQRARCRAAALERVPGNASAPPALDAGSRGEIGLAEMRLFAEILILPYLTQADTDPVFLDAEHILPAIFLALAAEERRAPSPPDEGVGPTVLDVGAFLGDFSLTALALWDALVAMPRSWQRAAFPPSAAAGPAPPPPRPAPAWAIALEPSAGRCGELRASRAACAAGGRPAGGNRSAGCVLAVCAAAAAESGSELLYCPRSPRGYSRLLVRARRPDEVPAARGSPGRSAR